ncbi:MAG: DUF6364 family protein [Chitinophagales bacterium]
MNSKLTPSLDKKVFERAKKYAKKKNTSLSKLIETYLNKTSSQEVGEIILITYRRNTKWVNGLDFYHRSGPFIRKAASLPTYCAIAVTRQIKEGCLYLHRDIASSSPILRIQASPNTVIMTLKSA